MTVSLSFISSLRFQQTFQQKPLEAVSFVIAKQSFKFKPKTFEAVPYAVEPKLDNEHHRNKRSIRKECICSAAIL